MKNTNIRFTLSLRLAAFALLAVLISSAAFAQTAAPKASLIIEQKIVRFDLQGAAYSWRLEVFNQPGDLVFANGGINQASLEWALIDQQEKPLADGLYVYTLKFWDENNQQISTQRGHVIINRASSSDRIWVTSNNSTGVGSSSELTVVGSPDATVGGARMAETRATAPARSTGDANVQQIKDNGAVNAIGPITGEGLANRIAKFSGNNAIASSVMTEWATNIRINTNTTNGKLSVVGGTINGIYGESSTSFGVYGQSTSNAAVRGISTSGRGVWGTSQDGTGVRGATDSQSLTEYGVQGVNTGAGIAISGTAANGTGVRGTTDSQQPANYGLHGINNGVGSGIRGDAQSGTGTAGISISGSGVLGQTSGGGNVAGVWGSSSASNGRGVIGRANGDPASMPGNEPQGVRGESANGFGVVGYGNTGVAGFGVLGPGIVGNGTQAGYFSGGVHVTGSLTVDGVLENLGAAVKIDHPLDPENKYLRHSVVESPEMLNIYNGTITTDANGVAAVTMPDYFEAFNRDFRYQLTVIGQFAQAIVAEKISGNHFTIKTDKPNVEVSWQVTGVRQDAAANANRKAAEELKPESERGHYLRPELFGQPEEKGIEWARNPEMMKRMKSEREQQQATKTKQ